ncbi:MAG TPA: Hpt domain-containing protein [Gemmatimonadaceae bacterium]
MTAPLPPPSSPSGGFLDFFVLEASDYIDQLDIQLRGGDAQGPDADAVQRAARALRGSATMAKLPAFAELAAGVERVGRALREGMLPWDAALRGAVVAAVDDAKILLRNVRAWGATDEARARARVAELARYAPTRPATPIASPSTTGHDSYLATEAANIGAGLELLATRPADRDAAANVLRRVRALRGIASVRDHAPLSDVLEASELAAHPLELGEPTLTPDRIALLSSAATVLRAVAAGIRSGRPVDPASPDLARFSAALDTMHERAVGTEAVVPIAELFYVDGGPTLVEAAQNPPTTPPERFRLEVVSQGEHLRGLVADARAPRDELARERIRRALRQALRALRQAAESFGEHAVAEFVAAHSDAAVRLDSRALDSLDELAGVLAQPGGATGSLSDRIAAPVAHAPSALMTPIVATSTIAPPTELPQQRDRPAAAAVGALAGAPPSARRNDARPTPSSGARAGSLNDLIDRGIRTLDTLPKTPLSSPVLLPEHPPVPIEVLLYRGRAALERAQELRTELGQPNAPLDADMMRELFDLIDLALTD